MKPIDLLRDVHDASFGQIHAGNDVPNQRALPCTIRSYDCDAVLRAKEKLSKLKHAGFTQRQIPGIHIEKAVPVRWFASQFNAEAILPGHMNRIKAVLNLLNTLIHLCRESPGLSVFPADPDKVHF